MPFIETTDGTGLHCKGWADGPALVFLAGWGLSSDFWQYQLAPLSERGLRCVAYDRRGHGRSVLVAASSTTRSPMTSPPSSPPSTSRRC